MLKTSDKSPVSINWLIGLCSVALFVPLAWPLLTGKVFVNTDLQVFNLPIRHLYQSALRAGDSPLWTPSLFSGFYLHGEGQAGMFHPLHLLLYRFLPLGAAFNLEMLASYLAAFAGMFWFLRRMAVRTSGALFGAMLFAFDGFLLLHYMHLNLVAVAAHIPWLLAAIDLVLSAGTRRTLGAGYAAVALVIASEFLIGFPQSVWFSLITAGAFMLFRANQMDAWSRLPVLAGAVVTGVLLGAVQWLPTLHVAALSERTMHGPEFRQSYSLHPWNLLQFWSPYVFDKVVYSALDYPWVHEFGIYTGAFAIIAPVWLWVRRKTLGGRRRLAVAALVFAGFSLILALGRYGLLNYALSILPGFRWSRVPARYIFLVHFALVVPAAMAFDDLLSLARGPTPCASKRTWIVWIPAGLSGIMLAALALGAAGSAAFRNVPFSMPSRAAIGTLLLAGVTISAALAARSVRWALALLIVVTAGDLALWGFREVYREVPRPIPSLTFGYPVASSAGGQKLNVRDENLGDLLVLNGFQLTSGYAALPPLRPRLSPEIVALQLSGTIWTWAPGSPLVPVPDPMPRARLVADARVVPENRGDDAEPAALAMDGIDPHNTVLIERAPAPLAGPRGDARVRLDRPGHIIVETDAPGRQILALTERFDSGWQATADGMPIGTARVNGDYLAAIVEQGTHNVELRFVPTSFVVGTRLSLAGFGVLGLALFLIMRGRSRSEGLRAPPSSCS